MEHLLTSPQKSGLGHSGGGQGCLVGVYDNDGWNDLFVTYHGQNMLSRTTAMVHLPT
jgi:hypothetical protein